MVAWVTARPDIRAQPCSPLTRASWMARSTRSHSWSRGTWTLADSGPYDPRMITVQYETKRNGEHIFWVGRHGPLIRIDANRPGVYRWTITRDSRSVASGVAADRDQAASDAAAALAELPR
jgi:hypothetical protein